MAIVGVLVALLLPAVQSSREAARRVECRHNLKQLGLALHSYESAHGALPQGSVIGPDAATKVLFGVDGVLRNAFTTMLPYLEERAIADAYDLEKAWYYQEAATAEAVLPGLVCPSNADKDNPIFEPFAVFAAVTVNSPIGGRFGLTDYVLSKGVSDAFCDDAAEISDAERGAFDYGLEVTLRQIVDGASHTFAIGEGAGGPAWPLCESPGCTTPDLSSPTPAFAPHGPYFARQFWIGSGNVQGIYGGFKWAATGHFACTLDPINHMPVTHFLFDNTDTERNCWGSLTNSANPHRVPGFRSDHPGGSLFLYLDGGVRFFNEQIDPAPYRGMSTVAGAEIN